MPLLPPGLHFTGKQSPYFNYFSRIWKAHFSRRNQNLPPDVDIYWQEKAWADTNFSIEWVRQILKGGTKPLEGKEFVLFCDNRTIQVSEEFFETFLVCNDNGPRYGRTKNKVCLGAVITFSCILYLSSRNTLKQLLIKFSG